MREIRIYQFPDGTLTVKEGGNEAAPFRHAEQAIEQVRQWIALNPVVPHRKAYRRNPSHHLPTIVMREVAQRLGISVDDITSSSRRSDYVKGRIVAFHVMQRLGVPRNDALKAVRRDRTMYREYEVAIEGKDAHGAFMREMIDTVVRALTTEAA